MEEISVSCRHGGADWSNDSVSCASAAESQWETVRLLYTRIRGGLPHPLLSAIMIYHYNIMGYWCPHCSSIHTNINLNLIRCARTGSDVLSLSLQRQPICNCQSIRNIEDFYISNFPRFFFFLFKIVHFLQPPSSVCSESTLRMMWADRYRQCNCKHEDHSSLPSSAILPVVHYKGITRNLFVLCRCCNNYIHRPWWTVY